MPIQNKCLYLFLFLFIVQCSYPKKIPPISSPPDIKDQLERAKEFYIKGNTQKALSELQEIATEAPFSDSADDAYILMGEYYYEHGQYEKAYKAYLSIIQSETHSPIEIYAYIGALRSLNQLTQYNQALSLVNQGLQKRASFDNQDIIKLREIKIIILNKLGSQIDSIENFISLSQEHPDEQYRKFYKTKAIEISTTHLNIKETLSILQRKKLKELHPFAHLNAATHYYKKKDFHKSKLHIKQIKEGGTSYEFANQLLQKIKSLQTVHKKTIGVILPLTGKHERHAHKTLRGLQLGLGIFSPVSTRSPYTLAVMDSTNNVDQARSAVQQLVVENHVIAIVGGLLSKTAHAISSKANELGIPNISLSQKPGITGLGDYIFRNALTSEMLVRHLVKIAMTQKALKRFAILYPNDPYGVEYANLFWDEVVARNGVITAVQTYDAKETDFNHVIKRLVGTFYLEDRQTEYKEALKKWMKQQRASPRLRSNPPKNLLTPIIDFDAIFVPDNIRALGQIAPMLVYHNIKDTPLLGTNLWNDSSLIKRGQRYVEDSLFVDGFSLSGETFKNSKFFHKYQKTFKEDPGIFALQAYDTGLIIRKILDSGAASRTEVRNLLSKTHQFKGSLGVLKLNQQREFLRPITGFQVVDGKIISADKSL